eukprot:scaffold87837_cov23-Cyclotella_meneghiniana.AAC.1
MAKFIILSYLEIAHFVILLLSDALQPAPERCANSCKASAPSGWRLSILRVAETCKLYIEVSCKILPSSQADKCYER